MAKLKYPLMTDTLFKIYFVKYPDLLKRLVSLLLGIRLESIGEFVIKNPEIPPESIGKKFCRLDINMTVDGRLVDLEIQVDDEGDYPERTLYYWAREYSTALVAGDDYPLLPQTIVISILAFRLFDCREYYSEFRPLEVTRHTLLSDKMRLIYFELCKLPKDFGADDELMLWLHLFKAKTYEKMEHIQELGGPIMKQAVAAYRRVSESDEFREIERMRDFARCNEVYAMAHAERRGVGKERKKWEGVVARKDAALIEKDAHIAELEALIAQLQAQ